MSIPKPSKQTINDCVSGIWSSEEARNALLSVGLYIGWEKQAGYNPPNLADDELPKVPLAEKSLISKWAQDGFNISLVNARFLLDPEWEYSQLYLRKRKANRYSLPPKQDAAILRWGEMFLMQCLGNMNHNMPEKLRAELPLMHINHKASIPMQTLRLYLKISFPDPIRTADLAEIVAPFSYKPGGSTYDYQSKEFTAHMHAVQAKIREFYQSTFKMNDAQKRELIAHLYFSFLEELELVKKREAMRIHIKHKNFINKPEKDK